MQEPTHHPWRRPIGSRQLAAVVACCCLLLLLPQTTAYSQDGGSPLEITKSVSTASVESNVPFEYTLAYACAATQGDCMAAEIVDVLPIEVDYIDGTASPAEDVERLVVTRNPGQPTTLRWIFNDPLRAGRTSTLRFQVKFKPGTVPGTTVQNTATFSATNFPPSTTAPVTTTVTGRFEMVASKSGGPAVVGFPTEFTMRVCSTDATGGVRFTNVEMTDTLPSGAIFVSAPGTEGVDWIYTPPTDASNGGTVRYLNLPTIDVTGNINDCLVRRLTLRYDSIPAVQPQNVVTVTGTPEGCSSAASLPPHCEGQTTRTLTAVRPFDVLEPFIDLQAGKSSFSNSSFQGTEAAPGERVTFNLLARNNGFSPLTAVTVVDDLPTDQLDLIEFTTGASPQRSIAVSYQVDNSGTWVAVPGSPFTANSVIAVTSLDLGGGQVVTDLRWELGDLPFGSEQWTATVVGQVKATVEPTDPPSTFDNCALISTTVLPEPLRRCTTVRIITDRAVPRIQKTIQPGPYSPGFTYAYTVTLTNASQAQLPLENPLIADLVPPEFTYVPDSWAFVADQSPPLAPAPAFEVLAGFGPDAGTLLRWRWQGPTAYSLQPGARLVVTYKVQVKPGTVAGTYVNRAALIDWTAPADPDDVERDNRTILLCTGDSLFVDDLDMDGDGNVTEQSCQSRVSAVIPIVAEMSSEKFVRGALDCATYGTAACEDGDYNKLGLTVPGGPVDYRLFITNTGNITVTNIVVIDIFPHVGDTGVKDLRPRGSQWRPNLQSAVAGPAGLPLTIFYSTQSNPCRPEFGVTVPGCTDPQWSTTLPADPTSVFAVKLDFCTYDNGVRTSDCLSLGRFESLQFDWPMVVPNGAPADPSCLTPREGALFDPGAPDKQACKIAWNSFAYSALEARDIDGVPGIDPDALELLPAEPNRVGMRLAPNVEEQLYAVGDLVWLDVAGIERDGIQQEIERTAGGINGVRVELYNGEGLFLDYRITGSNALDQGGYYLFPQLPPGRYQVRFCVPPGYIPTLQNVGSDDQLDSDGNTSGTSESCGGAYYATEVFDLPNTLTDANRADLSRDFGLWRPTDYGDNPNAPVQYPTLAISLTNPADAARHVIVDNLYFGSTVDAELDGQPATPADGDDRNGVLGEDSLVIDDEDGVVFLTPLQPCTTGQVQLTAFTGGRVAYYGAFFDWNGDGSFGPGEGATGTIGTPGAVTDTKVLAVAVPCSARQLVYMRFRLALDPAEVQTGTGAALSGEVEDYVLAAVGDRVWFDVNDDGLQGPPETEKGVPGVVATLCDGRTGQPVIVGGQPLTTTTNADGIYGFNNLPLGAYCVQFDLDTLPEDYIVTKPNVGGDDGRDSDADAGGRTGSTPLLGPAQVDLTLDMGIVSVTPTGEKPGEEPEGGFRMFLPDVRQ